MNNDGFRPAVGTGLTSIEDTVNWLADRIAEIEHLAEEFPPIAVLVTSEEQVVPFAQALNRKLADTNVRVVPCPFGQLAGQDSDVRVFDVRHIKGLEFEAVFFIGVDRLEQSQSNLFEKFLYVGATRAALFLGLTMADGELPHRIRPLRAAFGERWP